VKEKALPLDEQDLLCDERHRNPLSYPSVSYSLCTVPTTHPMFYLFCKLK